MTDATQKMKTMMVEIPAEVVDYFIGNKDALKMLSDAATETTVEVQPEKRSILISVSRADTKHKSSRT